MNRENKRKRYSKGYFKTHSATDAFTCKGCGRLVVPEGAGSSHRNHCPYCLHSLHLDEEPGDRASTCHGRMEPGGRLGPEERGVGHFPPVHPLWDDSLQPGGRRRQPHGPDGPCHAAVRQLPRYP